MEREREREKERERERERERRASVRPITGRLFSERCRLFSERMLSGQFITATHPIGDGCLIR